MVHELLAEAYPDAVCELDHRNAFELLTATIMSAPTTDVRVNMVTPVLFERYPTPEDLAAADPDDVEEIIRSTGFYKAKTRSIMGMARALVERHHGEVPGAMKDLVQLPGVGRKTANLVLILSFRSQQNICVDTHVHRISNRLGWVKTRTPEETEQALYAATAREWWPHINLYLVTWGQHVCRPNYPRCTGCTIEAECPKLGVTAISKHPAPERLAS